MSRFLSAVLLVLAAPALAAHPPLALEDVFGLRYASHPMVSADGERIVYLRHSMDILKDRRRSNLWQLRADGSGHRPLTTGPRKLSAPALSPQGDRVAWVESDGEASQIFLRWLDGGETAQLTRGAATPRNLAWSPDGRWIAFARRVPVEAPTMGSLPPPPKGAEWAAPPVVVDRVVYRNDGSGDRPRAFYQLFLVPADGGAARQLTEGPYDHDGRIAWSPDSAAIYFSANRNADRALNVVNSDLYRLALWGEGGLERLTDRQGPEGSVTVSPDGARLAFTGWEDRGQAWHRSRLYVMDVAGGEPRELLAALDRSLYAPQWSADGEHLYLLFDDRGDTVLARTDLAGKLERLASGLGGLSLGRPYPGAAYGAGGGRYAFTAGTAQRPADIATARDGAEVQRLTALNENLLGQRSLAAVEEFWVESAADGERIQAWLALPPGFDAARQYPLLLEIHGGPHTNYGARFSAEVQLYAAAGYVVLYVNPRGSTSYGERFANLIQHDYPGRDYDDLMSAVDAVLERGYVDPQQLYVTGGSGGGVLSAWIVGRTDRFRAAVVAKPVINWTSFVLTADNPPYFSRYWFPAMPWEDPQHYWRRSPLSLVGEVSTPTMLLTGEADLRTPIGESEQFYQALKLRGVDTAMVRIPGASHSIAKRPSQLMAKVAAVLTWFERHAPAADE